MQKTSVTEEPKNLKIEQKKWFLMWFSASAFFAFSI